MLELIIIVLLLLVGDIGSQVMRQLGYYRSRSFTLKLGQDTLELEVSWPHWRKQWP